MIPAPFGFFEVLIKLARADAALFGEPRFGKTPEGFDPIDVSPPTGKFIFRVVHPVVFEPVKHQPVISFPAIGVDGRRPFDLVMHHLNQLGFRAVGHDLRKYFTRSFEQADDGNFLRGPASAPSAHPARAEITFIDLHDAADKRLGFGLR